VLTRSEARLLKLCMNGLCHRLIGRRGSRRGHMGDEVGILFLTGFGDMHFVAGPPRLALFAIAGFLVIGRVDELFARRQILIAAKVEAAPRSRRSFGSRCAAGSGLPGFHGSSAGASAA